MEQNENDEQKDMLKQLDETSQKVSEELETNKEKNSKKNSTISIVVTIACIVVSIGILYICGTSILSFFSSDTDNNTTILSNYTEGFDGSYIKDGNYSINKMNSEIYYLNDQIPIIITEWTIVNNGELSGYPAAFLTTTQFKDGEEIELQDAENLLMNYDNNIDSTFWEERFINRYSNLEPGETKTFSTAHILYDINEDVNNQWSDLSGT